MLAPAGRTCPAFQNPEPVDVPQDPDETLSPLPAERPSHARDAHSQSIRGCDIGCVTEPASSTQRFDRYSPRRQPGRSFRPCRERYDPHRDWVGAHEASRSEYVAVGPCVLWIEVAYRLADASAGCARAVGDLAAELLGEDTATNRKVISRLADRGVVKAVRTAPDGNGGDRLIVRASVDAWIASALDEFTTELSDSVDRLEVRVRPASRRGRTGPPLRSEPSSGR